MFRSLVLPSFILSVIAGSSLVACAKASNDDTLPVSVGEANANEPEYEGDNRASLPQPTGGSKDTPATPPKNSSTSSSSGGASSSSSSSGSTSSSSSSTGGAGVPACTWSGDFLKMISKMDEIEQGLPCDSSCNPTTHCCYDMMGGGGGGGGMPGMDGGTGMATGSCVSN